MAEHGITFKKKKKEGKFMISFCLQTVREINPKFINQQNMSRVIKGKHLAVKVKQVLSKFKGNVWQDLQMNYNYCFAVVCLCAI